MATPRPPRETSQQRLMRKANDIRAAFIASGLVVSPESEKSLTDIPADRQEKWIKLARAYMDIFYTREPREPQGFPQVDFFHD